MDFTIEPYLWQTVWFRILAVTGLASGCGLAAWRATQSRYQRRIALLKKEQALEREQARLATILEATTDMVAFARTATGACCMSIPPDVNCWVTPRGRMLAA